MKKTNLFVALFVSCLAFVTLSCSSDNDSNNEYNNLEKYLQLENANFKGGNLPQGSEDFVAATFAKKVINGGSSIVTVVSSQELSKIYLGVKGEEGYYEYDVNAVKSDNNVSGNYSYQLRLLVSQTIDVEEFVLRLSAASKNGATCQARESGAIGVQPVGTGLLQVSLAWDQFDDVDLHLVEPDGNVIYYSRRKSTVKVDEKWVVAGELDLDSNPACWIDEVNNENITYENYLKKGTYKVYVNLYSKCDRSKVGSTYSVTIYYKGQLLNISDRQVGKFADDFFGDRMATSAVEIGSFTINEGIEVVQSKSITGLNPEPKEN